ncbi:Putative transcriptional regulator yvhJ [uncultured Clostridium sp.]|uniref:LCP family protein n=1 Tax=uncultured Clostridium sp. TaxID=59620 RepID=UPI0008234566|nr:LCP family protein [uncultured Clostridium sp.]SCJ90113.1 Putative transcriptional regulator yvhJ [uncultured Clostridium sp.]
MAGNGDKNRPKKDPRLITKSAREEFERKKEFRKKAKRKARIRMIIVVLIFLLLLIISTMFFSVISFITALKKNDLQSGITPRKNEPVNILILGMDIGDADQEENKSIRRTDTMMVLNYNPNTEKINIVSIPRDTLIQVDAYDEYGNLRPYWKINNAYVLGGEEEVIKHVESLLETTINYIVEIDYDAFRNFIDAIGGIDMYIEQQMDYDDNVQNLHIHFNQGETVHLDGKKAEEFFRWRKNNDGTGFVDGDLGRIRNQQAFMKQVLKKCLNPTIIFKLPKILDVVKENIDTNMPGDKMVSYGLRFLTNSGISMNTLQGYDEIIYNEYFLVVEADKNREILAAIKSGEVLSEDKSRADYNVLVLNGTRINGLAGNVKSEMESIGYSGIVVDNADKRSKSIIMCNDKDLKEQLKIDTGINNFQKNNNEEYGNYDAVIILGEDFDAF